MQNFVKAKERGIDVQLFVRKNKDDKISKEFYYLGRMTATGRTEEFVMANTDKTAVEIEWALDTPVREDIYEYIINGERRRRMKTIKVVAAIIIDNGKAFATQRGYGEFKDGWEFPGGKIEEGETAREAIVREIREELDTEIQVEELLDTVEYDYPKFHLSMDCFICTVKSGDLVLKEHEAAKWLTKETLESVEWLPADEGLIEKIREYIQKN